MKCEKCNTEMIYEQKGHSCSWICPKCGWGIATTYNTPLELDMIDYTLHVFAQSDSSIDKLKCISRTFHINFIESKQALTDGNISITDKATNIIGIKNELEKFNIQYQITPEFPY